MLGLASSLVKGGASLLTFVKDNLKLYLDFKSSRSDTLAFPSEGSTAYSTSTPTYIDFGDNDTLDMGTSSFTCAGWIKLNASSSTSRMMLGKTQQASGAQWSFGVSGSEQVFISISDGSTSVNETGATTISIGEWVYVAGVYDTDADTLSVFLNGVQDATMSASGVGSLSNSLNLRSGRGAEYPYNYNNNFQVANIAIWKRPLALEEINSVMNKSYSQLGSVEKTSLVAWWALDQNEITALNFDGSNDKVENTSFTTHQTNTGTISGWFIFNDLDGTQRFFGVGGNSVAGTNRTLQVNGASLSFIPYGGGGGSYDWDTTADLTVGVLYHLAVTWNSTNVVVYVNGTGYSQTLSGLITPAGTKFKIGEAVWGTGDDANIKCMSASVYTATLSESEIQSIYNNGYSTSEVGNNNIAHYWIMNNGSTVTDLVGSKNLTVTGATLVTNARQSDSKSTNHGVTIGATTTTSVYGGNAPILPRAIDIAESFADAIGNGSASFDGDDDFIQVDNITLPNLEPYTITAWIKTTDVDQTQAIVLWGDQASYERRALILYNGGNGSDWTLVASTNGNNAQGDTTVTEGEWTHASITVTPSTKAYKIYMNGILDGSGTFSNSLVAFSNSTLLIGKSYYGEFFEGNISGVGIWYGELTQEKIQSVMESTSYAKIPASVKSTLGSELVTSITNSTSNPWETFSGASGNTLASATNDAGTSGEMFSQQLGLSADTLVKVTVTVTLNAGTIKAQFCAADGSFTSGDLNEIISTSGTHSFYAIISASSKDILWIKHQTSPLDISNLTLSVKEVTNDLVAYYPLDAGENSNMSKDYTIADSLMTFGDNLLADGDAGSDGWTNDTGGTNPPAVNEKSSEYAKEGTFSRKFVADGGTDAVNTPTFTTETGATYQVSFWIRPNSTSQNFYIYQGDGSGTNTFIAEATSTTWLRSYTANQWNKLVGYFTESGGGSNAYLQFESPSSSDATYYIDEVKVKKVLSGNYGRLL